MGKRQNNKLTNAIAGLATFTAIVWIGVVGRVLILRHIHKTPVAHAPENVQSKPAPPSESDPASPRPVLASPQLRGPGGVFPGDTPGFEQR
ncbi:MAG: hypothetical protein ACKVS6_06365 [Planctomycetota bacterium]